MDRFLILIAALTPWTGHWTDSSGTRRSVECPTNEEFVKHDYENEPIRIPEGCRSYGSVIAYDRLDWLRLKKRLDLAEAWRSHDAKELRKRNRELIDCKNKIEEEYRECSSSIYELADSMRCPPHPVCPTCSEWSDRALGFTGGIMLCGGAMLGGRF